MALSPTLWLDGTKPAYSNLAGTTVAQNGEAGAVWPDRSGHNNVVNQPDVAMRPTRIERGFNFNSIGQKLQSVSVNVRSVFIAYSYNTATFNNYSGLLTGNTRMGLVCAGDQGATRFYDYTVFNRYQKNGVDFPVTDMQAAMGNQVGLAYFELTSNDIPVFQIGENRTFQNFWNGSVFEVLLFSTVLTEQNINYINSYLLNKHGIAL